MSNTALRCPCCGGEFVCWSWRGEGVVIELRLTYGSVVDVDMFCYIGPLGRNA
jgi:hypothetical protein